MTPEPVIPPVRGDFVRYQDPRRGSVIGEVIRRKRSGDFEVRRVGRRGTVTLAAGAMTVVTRSSALPGLEREPDAHADATSLF